MIKCLYAGGDSWTEGDELGSPITEMSPNNFDWDQFNTPLYRYHNSWPKLLADKLDIPVCINDGWRGTSGERIFRRASRFIRHWCKTRPGNELLVSVCWTTLERDELPLDVQYNDGSIRPYFIPYHHYSFNKPDWSQISEIPPMMWETIERMHPLYTLTVGEIGRSDMQYERMCNLRDIAKAHGVKLVQSFALDCPAFNKGDYRYRQDWQEELKYLQPEFINFVRANNLKQAPGGHCLEEGHKSWANFLYEHINKNIGS